MDIEQMKLEALGRTVFGAIRKVEACHEIINSMIDTANNPNIPVGLEELKKANATRYAEVVDVAKKAVAELETCF